MEDNKRLYDIDRAKGMAIFLVVLGHLWSGGSALEEVASYLDIKYLIYRFHMPFFMFLSGLIYYYTYKHINTIQEYIAYAAKKITRLAPAYLLFGILILFGKMIFSQFLYVEGINNDLWDAILDMVVYPSKSVARSLWYIYVLLELYLLTPLLLRIFGNNSIALLAVSGVAHFIPTTSYFMINLIFEYLLYFSLGIVAIRNYDAYQSAIDRFFPFFFVLFVTLLISTTIFGNTISKLVISLCSIPALHGLARRKICKNIHVFYIFGIYTYAIYLMNTITIGVIKGVVLEFVAADNINFLIFNLVLVISGLLLPILIKKHILVRIRYIDKITS